MWAMKLNSSIAAYNFKEYCRVISNYRKGLSFPMIPKVRDYRKKLPYYDTTFLNFCFGALKLLNYLTKLIKLLTKLQWVLLVEVQ